MIIKLILDLHESPKISQMVPQARRSSNKLSVGRPMDGKTGARWKKISGNARLTSEYKLTITFPMHDPVTRVLA